MSQEKLHFEIIVRSEATTWEKARQEWGLKDVWMSDEPETCLCGHHPINEICEIENRENGTTTEVGNCCVNHFLGIDSDQIFRSIKNVLKEAGASFNPPTIELAHQLRIIGDKDREFYLDIWRKRELTSKQLKWKQDINRKLMARFVKKRASL
jgi:hypothetical protein